MNIELTLEEYNDLVARREEIQKEISGALMERIGRLFQERHDLSRHAASSAADVFSAVEALLNKPVEIVSKHKALANPNAIDS